MEEPEADRIRRLVSLALTEEGRVISTFDQVSFFAFDGAKQSCPNHNFLDMSGNIRADGSSPYIGLNLNAEDVAAVCGGICVDGDGTLHSVVDAEADEPLPVFDLER